MDVLGPGYIVERGPYDFDFQSSADSFTEVHPAMEVVVLDDMIARMRASPTPGLVVMGRDINCLALSFIMAAPAETTRLDAFCHCPRACMDARVNFAASPHAARLFLHETDKHAQVARDEKEESKKEKKKEERRKKERREKGKRLPNLLPICFTAQGAAIQLLPGTEARTVLLTAGRNGLVREVLETFKQARRKRRTRSRRRRREREKKKTEEKKKEGKRLDKHVSPK